MKFKKAVMFLLCAMLCLSLLACGNIDFPDGDTPGGGEVPAGEPCSVVFDVGAEAKAAGVNIYPLSITVKSGMMLVSGLGENSLPDPKWEGHTFGGWFDSTGTQYIVSTRVNKNVTLTARWTSDADREEYEKNIASWAKPDHLYIHYKRFGHDAGEQIDPPTAGVGGGAPDYSAANPSKVYGDWGLWAWPKNNANGRLFNAAWIDESGAVYDVDLTKTYTDCGWDGDNKVSQNVTNTFVGATEVGVQIHQISTRTDRNSEFWANDGGDNTLIMEKYKRDSGDYHWFVQESYVSTKEGYGSPTFSKVDRVDPYADDPDRTKNATKTSGANIISNSAADNSSMYSVKSVQDFDASNGYQIFIASFADSNGDGLGDIPGIIGKIPYLKSLNVDLLWLTPFQTSTGYHGYDISDYYTVDPRWGTDEQYRALIKAAHDNGMKIVMDYVLNHTSLSNEWFIKSQNLVKEKDVTIAGNHYDEVDYRQFYSWINADQYKALGNPSNPNTRTPAQTHWYKDNNDYYFYSSFNSSQPELNYDYQPVRDSILEVCYHWLELGLDGFRLDAVKHIYMCNEVKGKNSSVNYTSEFSQATKNGNNMTNPVNYDHVADKDTRFNYDIKRNLNFYREFNFKLKTRYPGAFVVGENLDGWDQRMASFNVGIDSQFDFALYYNVARGILKSAGVPGAFGDGLGAIYNRYYRGYQAYTKYNQNYVGGQFTSNHDLPRARDRMNITDANEDGDTYGSFYTNGTIDGLPRTYAADDEKHKGWKQFPNSGTVVESKVNKSTDMLKIYYAALMTLPGVNWLYYGDELGMSGLMQFTLASSDNSTSSTASDAHEDIIYRQPMKWNKATNAGFDKATHTSHGNAAFEIGYEDIKCELTGINATDYVPSVAECTNADGSFKSGTLLDWVAKLYKMRKDKGLGSKARVTLVNQNKTYCEYRVQGTKGSITVKFSTGALSGAAYNGLSFGGSGINVLITG